MTTLDGDCLRETREQLGWSQRQLAGKAGVNSSVISRLERNLQGDVSLTVVVALSRAMNVRVDDLLADREKNSQAASLHPDWQMVVAQINNLPLPQQGQVAAILKGYLSSL